MSNHDDDDAAAEAAARAELTRAVVACQQLLDEHARHAGYRTSAEWLTPLAGYSAAVNDAVREYLKVTSPVHATA